MKTKGLLALYIISLVSLTSRSQDSSKYISLQEAITSSIANNDEIRLSVLNEQIALLKIHQADAFFLPHVRVSYTAVTTNNPLNAFGFKLQQRLITGADFNPKLLNNPSPTTDFSTKFELQQSLLNNDMLFQRKEAAKQVEMSKFISQRTKEYLLFETEKAYLQLQVQYEANKVLQEAYDISKVFYKTSEDYYNEGLVQKSDLLNAELHVMDTETRLKNSLSNIQDASDRLSILMGKPTGTIYTADPITQNMSVPVDSFQLTDDRADFKALKKGIEGYDLMIRSSKTSYLPKLNAFASFQLNDKYLFGFNTNAYLVGIQLSWDIFNGNSIKNTIIQQNLERDKLLKQLDQQRSEAQVQSNHAKRTLADASFSIKQQKLGVEQALQALLVLQNRYTQGLVKTSDVLQAQIQLSQQKLAAVEAVFNYNFSAAYLEFLATKK